MRIIERLLKSLRAAATFDPEIQVAPACILWPDRDRQWEAVIPRLQAELPELLILGDYAPDKRTGPAIWLRCVIAGKINDVLLPEDHAPIFYLPGVSRQDLRAVESCPDHLKPLAELQYRGVIWSQINAKDWTILAYLKSDQGGLGLDVAQDNDTRNAMQLALYRLLDEEVALLKGKRLDKDYFNTLLTGGDPVRDLLQWLDQGDAFQAGRGENEWKAFVEVCKSQLAFNPQNEGVLAGAAKLATHEGPWRAVWERFCEAPQRYPKIPDLIRKCQPPVFDLFADEKTAGGWPQWNKAQEKALHRDLQALGNAPTHEARKKLLDMEKQHERRRSLLWAELGEAPLAMALEHLAVLADVTTTSHIDGLLAEIRDRIAGLLAADWKSVRVVTDHGWLLLPGGLPKIDLPSALADSKWGRCASLKPGASTAERLYPWYWNPSQHFALADGISCFKKGEEYAHGGLSLQECLTLQLSVSRSTAAEPSVSFEITDVVWKGLRCTVAADGSFSGLYLDIRLLAGNASSSVVVGAKPLKDNGTASVVVENEELEGHDAAVVLLDANGALVAQVATVIGGRKP